jgi:DNA-binding NarL/FixJ family response regulator
VPFGPAKRFVRRRAKTPFDRGEEVAAPPTVDEKVGEAQELRVLVAARCWWWREAILRVLERRGLRPVDEPHLADVAIVDLDDVDGSAQLAALRRRELPCIALAESSSRIASALAASASYAVKGEVGPDRLAQLARLAARGDELFVHAGGAPLEGLGEPPAKRLNLTPRELDVLRHLADGRTNAEIAAALHLAPSSVKKLVSRCLARLGVRNRVEAALVARREGVVTGHVY